MMIVQYIENFIDLCCIIVFFYQISLKACFIAEIIRIFINKSEKILIKLYSFRNSSCCTLLFDCSKILKLKKFFEKYIFFRK